MLHFPLVPVRGVISGRRQQVVEFSLKVEHVNAGRAIPKGGFKTVGRAASLPVLIKKDRESGKLAARPTSMRIDAASLAGFCRQEHLDDPRRSVVEVVAKLRVKRQVVELAVVEEVPPPHPLQLHPQRFVETDGPHVVGKQFAR